jgi:hypothetical protein
MSQLALIPLITGYSPKTWRTGIDSMIPKKTLDLRPEKLRLILLMDARFNHNNKLIGKKMMEYGEKYNLLAPEQFGSRKHKSAIEHATNKRFTLDIVRQSRQTAIYIANDAKSCYDRIILMVAYLTMRNFGIPETVAKSTIDSILRMKHFVRTKYGDSSTHYGGEDWKVMPHGCGQGNGYGPALWACISSPLLHILRQQGYGTKIVTPMSEHFIHLAAFSFVDDTDIIQIGGSLSDDPEGNVVEQLFDNSQTAINLWSQLLAATGGALESSKTFYVPIITEQKGTKLVLSTKYKERRISLEDDNGERTYLLQKDPTEAFFTLGIWQSPTGNEERQKKHLIDIIKEWGVNTTTNKLTWHHARLAVRSTIGKTLEYPLAATTFNQQQSRAIQKTLLHETLGKMGIVRTTPWILAVAPITLGGFGILSIEVEQLIQHILIILQHGPDRETTTGKLLRCTIEYNALETGFPGDPLWIPWVSYTTQNTWIRNTLWHMKKYNIGISSDLERLQEWTEEDTFLMEQLQEYGTDATKVIINKVRMYLRITTLSDIITADGKTYDANILQGKRGTDNPSPSFYRYQWPSVPLPTPSERAVWNTAIVYTFAIPSSLTRPNMDPIRWTQESLLYARWLFSATEQKLYERKAPQQWIVWRPKPENRRHRTRLSTSTYMVSSQITSQIPSNIGPASIRRVSKTIVTVMSTGTLSTTDGTPISRQSYSTPSRALDIFRYNITMNNGIIFTDGSYKQGVSTFAWAAQPPYFITPIGGVDFQSFAWASDYVQGENEDQNSYRAELGGILAAILYTTEVCQTHNITRGECTLVCDNKGALFAAFGHKRPTPRWASYDIVRQIRTALRVSPIVWRHKHIKGHQDTNQRFENLHPMIQGNVLVDHLAMLQRRQPSDPSATTANPWTISINALPVGGTVDSRIREAIFKPLMIKKWSMLFNVTEDQAADCDWDLFFRSLTHHQPHIHIQLIKFLARLLPVGTNLKRRRHSDTGECILCGHEETHDHLIQCTNHDMTATFNSAMEELQQWLIFHTSESILKDILMLARAFHTQDHNWPQVHQYSARVRQQVVLGQRAFFAGLWSKQWTIDQERYYNSIQTRRDPHKWMSHITAKIQQIPLKMWQMRNELRNLRAQTINREEQTIAMNTDIDNIFHAKPHDRLMAHCDSAFFKKHSQEQVKAMKVHRKKNWIVGAKLILTKYKRIDTPQTARFTSYFQWDRG